jgi:uncharacterized protein
MIRLISWLAALFSLFLGAPALYAQADDLKPVKIKNADLKDVDPALWVVKDGDTTIYLFGSVHVLKPGMGWFDDGVKAAFDASDTLVLELVEPPAAEVAKIMADLSIDKSGNSLREKMSAEDRAVFEDALKKLKIAPETLDPLDPWAAALNVYYAGLFKSGYDPLSGVETQLTAAAKVARKPVIGLETMRSQLLIFDRLPLTTQIGYAVDVAKAVDDIEDETDKLVARWARADIDGVASIMNEGFDSLGLTEPLLTRRNANWARWIAQRMKKKGTVFVAVGAGHLAGPVSVQQLIEAYGLKAERVNY